MHTAQGRPQQRVSLSWNGGATTHLLQCCPPTLKSRKESHSGATKRVVAPALAGGD